jgi:hypothetical protein
MSNILMINDGFDADAQDSTKSPIRGTNMRFAKGDWLEFGDEIDVKGKRFCVRDKRAGWQKLQEGCPPEYVMQIRGQPKPDQPVVPEDAWPFKMDGSGQREHPYRWTTFVYLVDTKTGELSTLSGNTTGFNMAIGELSDQISFMREIRPNALPIIELETAVMPNEYHTLRPKFRVVGWCERESTAATPALPAPEQKQLSNASENTKPTPTEKPADKIATPATSTTTKKKKTTKRGAARADTGLKPMAEPSVDEILNDKIDF